jgi:SAM-dependent methyltransferase
MTEPSDTLRRQFGDIDIYLFDQLHRGNITIGMRVLDAGFGHGRNLVYLLRQGFDVSGVDVDVAAIDAVRRLVRATHADADARFRAEPVESMSFADASFDVVISSAVLHFAADERQWHAMMREMWRVLATGGLFFARLATTVGHESQVRPLGNRRFIMPDGDERFLVDESFILASMNALGGTLVDPIKTSVVHGKRSMMTWVMRRP